MADYYDTGTVSVPLNGKTATGIGTSWAGIVRAGDTLACDGRYIPIASDATATSCGLLLPSPVAITNRPYAILFTAPSRTSGLQAMADIRRLLEVSDILTPMRAEYEVQSATLNAPPATPVTSDMYLISTAPTGEWAGRAGHLAQWTGTGWTFTVPQFAMRAVARDTGQRWARGFTAWGLSPDLVSMLAVSGNINDALGGTFPRALTINGPVLSQGNAFALQTDSNAHLWFRNADGSRLHGLVFYNFSPGSMCVRTYIDGGPAFHELAVLPDGQVNAPNVVPNSPTRVANKAYVDAQIATQFTSAASWDGVGSTIMARNSDVAQTATGNTVAGSSLRLARIMWSGATASHSSTVASGTWRLCGGSHNANDDDICLYRRIA